MSVIPQAQNQKLPRSVPRGAAGSFRSWDPVEHDTLGLRRFYGLGHPS